MINVVEKAKRTIPETSRPLSLSLSVAAPVSVKIIAGIRQTKPRIAPMTEKRADQLTSLPRKWSAFFGSG